MNEACRYITQFDSSTSMLYALGSALNEKEFSGVQVVPDQLKFVTHLLNLFPFKFRQSIYRWSGGFTAIDNSDLKKIDSEEISSLVVAQYPRRHYPAIMIGSSNGALIHLAAAMGIPWLPQTFLVAARRQLEPDEIKEDIEWGRTAAQTIRKKNPDLRICQMHDPVQDRLMVSRMAYFRIKRLKLGIVYENFIKERLSPDGTIFIIDTSLPWPTMQVGEEHTFQIGGLGAVDAYEYLSGSERVNAFLKSHGSKQKNWHVSEKFFEAPESEWGFARPLEEDLVHFVTNKSYLLRKIEFTHPEDPSPFIADLYRWWYSKNNVSARRLIAECFSLLEPWLMLRTASVPFWLAFNTEPSLMTLKSYLEKTSDIAETYLMLMSNGVHGIGQVSIDQWKAMLDHFKKKYGFLGVNEQKYPMDFTSFVRYHDEFKSQIPISKKELPLLPLLSLDEFVSDFWKNYPLHWKTLQPIIKKN